MGRGRERETQWAVVSTSGARQTSKDTHARASVYKRMRASAQQRRRVTSIQELYGGAVKNMKASPHVRVRVKEGRNAGR